MRMSNPLRIEPSSHEFGEFEGVKINITDKILTIPSGIKGNGSYIQLHYSSHITSLIKETGKASVLIKLKFNGFGEYNKVPSGITVSTALGIPNIVKQNIKAFERDGNNSYLLIEVTIPKDSEISGPNPYFRVYVQIDSSFSPVDYERSIKIEDCAIWVSDWSIQKECENDTLKNKTVNKLIKYCPNPDKNANVFIKYASNLLGTITNSTQQDNRISKLYHRKFDGFYVKGEVSTDGSAVATQFIIDNNNPNNEGYKNLFVSNISTQNGAFESFISIPSDIWDKVDLNHGYRAFLFWNNDNKVSLNVKVIDSYAISYPGCDSPFIIDIDALEDTIENTKNIKQLSSVINIEEPDKLYGRYDKDLLDSFFGISANINNYATVRNSQTDIDGYLSEIRVQVSAGGNNFIFMVGLYDQYSRWVPSKTFTINIPKAGNNTIDVSSLNIPISKGEQLAIKCVGDKETSSIKFSINNEPINNDVIYGTLNGTWGKVPGTAHGGIISLSYKVKNIDSIFALKSQIKELETLIEKQTEIINAQRYFYDTKGNAYKPYIVDGELKVKSLTYKKVLALGNSLTSHHYAPTLGYYGDPTWAMSSTNKVETTWTNFLQTILRQKESEATVTPLNISSGETNYMACDFNSIFSSHKLIDYDLIVIRAGENGTAGDDYGQGVDRLVKYLQTNFPKADIIITDMFWHNSVKEAGFKEIADKYNYPYIPFGNIADKCLLGQQLMGVDNSFHTIINNGVAEHCSDVCFFDFANIVASALGYKQIEGKHSVVMNTTKEYELNNIYQIHKGYVTILTFEKTQPSITVQKSNGESVSNQIFNLAETEWINEPSKKPTYAVVFQMPDEDVTVDY